jgi:hypothetical protein
MGQGNDISKNEDCLAVNIQQSALLRDENCDSKMRYICEVHNQILVNCKQKFHDPHSRED